MVQSRINSKVNYVHHDIIDSKDFNTEMSSYDVELFELMAEIVVGHINTSKQEDGVIFFPIYLVSKDESFHKIGIFEFETHVTVLDDEGELDIDVAGKPLLFPQVNKAYVQSHTTKHSISFTTDDVFVGNKIELSPLKQEIDDEDKISKSEPWVRKYFKSKHYSLVDNEGGGDCLFAVVRDAFESINLHTDVQKLRDLLAKNVKINTFTNLKEHYKMFQAAYNNLKSEIKVLKKEKANGDKLLKQGNLYAKKDELQHIKVQIKEKNAELQTYSNNTNTGLLDEIIFMKDIETFEQFKDVIRTNEYWADEWGIPLLEEQLNVKIIIFSHRTYLEKDNDNVLQCGYTINKDTFNPDYYILADHHNANHYELITYKGRSIFTFDDLPLTIRNDILSKCIGENTFGSYHIIPDFAQLKQDKKSIHEIQEINKAHEEEAEEAVDSVNVGFDESRLDDSVVFAYYSGSANKMPGKGSSKEQIPKERIPEFAELAAIPDWRKMLSNFYLKDFILKGKKWASVEHYYHATKFTQNKEFYNTFSLDSGSDMSKDPLLAKAYGGKTGKFKNKIVRPSHVTMDSDSTAESRLKNEIDAVYAKFSQNLELKKMLLATKNAKLMHYLGRGHGTDPYILAKAIMIVRSRLQNQKHK